MGKTLSDDLGTIGDKLSVGEAALTTALGKAQDDFTVQTGLMADAAAKAGVALNTMALDITNAMNAVAATIAHWTFVMTNPAGAKDPNWDYQTNAPIPPGGTATPSKTDVWVDTPTADDPDLQTCIDGPNKGKTRERPGSQHPAPTPGGTRTPAATTATGHTPSTTPTTAPTVNVAVTVNSGTPEDIAQAAADAVYGQTLTAIQTSQQKLVLFLKNNGAIPAWTAAAR